jgi:hypothetical protein
MKIAGTIEVLFVAGFGPIVREITTSRKFYGEALGIPFKEESGGYLHTEALQGAKKREPWSQTVTRLLSPQGLLVGITFTPLMRKEK